MVIIISPNIQLEEDLVRYRLNNVRCYIESHFLDEGTLYIYLDRIVWINNNINGDSFSINFEFLNFFAICRDLVNYDRECIMLVSDVENDMIERFLPRERPPDYEDAADENTITLRLLPLHENLLEEIYQNLRDLQREYLDENRNDNQNNNESLMLYENGDIEECEEEDDVLLFEPEEEPDQFEDAPEHVELVAALHEARERALDQELLEHQRERVEPAMQQRNEENEENEDIQNNDNFNSSGENGNG